VTKRPFDLATLGLRANSESRRRKGEEKE